MTRLPGFHLGWKIAAWLMAVLAGVGGLLTLLLLAAESRLLEDATRRHLELVVEVVGAHVPPPLAAGGGHPWSLALAPPAAPGVPATLRLLRADGEVLASTRPGEPGTRLPTSHQDRLGLGELLPAHTPGLAAPRPLVGSVYRRAPGPPEPAAGARGATVHSLVRPLDPLARCGRSCHGPTPPPPVFLAVEVAGEALHPGLGTFRQVALGSWLGLLLLVPLLVAGLVSLLIRSPLQRLTRTMEKAEAGDLLVRAPEGRGDELGRLARAFNNLLRRTTELRATVRDTSHELQSELELKEQLWQRSQALAETNQLLEARLNEISLLLELTRVVSSSLDLERILDAFSERLAGSLDIPRVAVALLTAEPESLTIRSAHGFPERERLLGLQLPAGSIPWVALAEQQPLVVPDTRDEPRVSYFAGRVREEGSLAAIPFRGKGRMLGVLILSRPAGTGFTPAEVQLLGAIGDQAGIAVANSRLHEEARTQALTDPLTGLYNRRVLMDHLELEWSRCLRYGQPLSLLMIDLDFFKEYNDTNGHLFGDRALVGVANLLRSALRQADTVARYGGEEFVVLLPSTSEEGALGVADKLRRLVAGTSFPGAEQVSGGHLTISVGVTTLRRGLLGEGEHTLEELLTAADRGLYRAKEEGRDRVFFEALG